MSDDATPSVRTVRLGLELRQIRRELGLTLEQAHKLVKRSISSLSRIENGQVRLPERDVPPILDAYGITDKRRREALLVLARDAPQKELWQQYKGILTRMSDLISLENEATEILTFQTLFIPGLMQMRDYAYDLFRHGHPDRPPHANKRLTDVRMTRQRILHRGDAPTYVAVVTEGVLHQLVGGPLVMRRQLQHLSELAARRKVQLHVLPFTSGAHAAHGSFTLLTVPTLGGSLVQYDRIAGSGILDDEEVISRHRIVFESVRSAALPEADSLTLIERLAVKL